MLGELQSHIPQAKLRNVFGESSHERFLRTVSQQDQVEVGV